MNSIDYDLREVRVCISTVLAAPDVNIADTVALGSGEVMKPLIELLDRLRLAAAPACRGARPEADTLPGDEPMIQVEIKYSEMRGDEDGIVAGFDVVATETIDREAPASALPNAINAALRAFAKRVDHFTKTEGQ